MGVDMTRIRMVQAAASLAFAAGVLFAAPALADSTTAEAPEAPATSQADIGWGAPPASPEPTPSPTMSANDIGWG